MSAIFCHGDEQLSLAECSRDEKQKKSTKKIFTKITVAEKFYDAEEYVPHPFLFHAIHLLI